MLELYPDNADDSIDNILGHVKKVIEYNIEKENKLQLLKLKIEELKTLFKSTKLSKLNKLKFSFEEEIIELEVNKESNKTYQGVELPPKSSNGKLKESV